MDKVKIVSIIVGRKGSAGLPSKCMLPIDKMPVIEHVIKWAVSIDEPYMEHIVVISSDIEELDEIARRYGCIFLDRSRKLASDRAIIEDVVWDALDRLSLTHCDYVSLLYGNIPIRHKSLFIEPLRFLKGHPEFQGVLTFQNVEKFNPSWMVELNTDCLPKWELKGHRRQELKQYMIHDGHTCISRMEYFITAMQRRNKSKSVKQMYECWGGLSIKPWLHEKLVVDIDTERDYLIAKAIIESSIILHDA